MRMAGSYAFDDLLTSIAAGVIGDDQFNVWIRLTENRVDGGFHPVALVVTQADYRYKWTPYHLRTNVNLEVTLAPVLISRLASQNSGFPPGVEVPRPSHRSPLSPGYCILPSSISPTAPTAPHRRSAPE